MNILHWYQLEYDKSKITKKNIELRGKVKTESLLSDGKCETSHWLVNQILSDTVILFLTGPKDYPLQ